MGCLALLKRLFGTGLGVFFLSVGAIGFIMPSADAKDLSGRIGIGFMNEFSSSSGTFQVPALSAKYALTKDLAISGAAGINTTSPGGYSLGAKVYKNIFYETNLNFYVAAGAGLVKRDQLGIEFLGVFGTEIFIPGVDSLGLSFEAGASLSNITGSFVVKTIGFTFLHAGVHFYF